MEAHLPRPPNGRHGHPPPLTAARRPPGPVGPSCRRVEPARRWRSGHASGTLHYYDIIVFYSDIKVFDFDIVIDNITMMS